MSGIFLSFLSSCGGWGCWWGWSDLSLGASWCLPFSVLLFSFSCFGTRFKPNLGSTVLGPCWGSGFFGSGSLESDFLSLGFGDLSLVLEPVLGWSDSFFFGASFLSWIFAWNKG